MTDTQPQVVASYAAYLHARTRVTPEITISGGHAEVRVTVGAKTLTLALRYRGREWALHTAKVTFGDHNATFTRGHVLDAVSALLR